MSEHLSPAEQSVLVFAARYAHTRKTGAAMIVVDAILENWDKLTHLTQEQIRKEARNEATCNFEDWRQLGDV